MRTLWDTDAGAVSIGLSAERRAAGVVASGLVLTLVVVVDEREAAAAMQASTVGAAAHPCRLILVIRRQPDLRVGRLDAEVGVGGHLGTGESIELRCYGPLARHAESVVLPLLAPDTPVVAWWYGDPPNRLTTDPIARLADRRVTDAAKSDDPLAALRARAGDYTPGDTDLAWPRTSQWRSTIAAAFDSVDGRATSAAVVAGRESTSGALLAGWLAARLGVPVTEATGNGRGIREVSLNWQGDDGEGTLRLTNADDQHVLFTRTGQTDRMLPNPLRTDGDLIGEELRHLDPDTAYAEALTAAVARIRGRGRRVRGAGT